MSPSFEWAFSPRGGLLDRWDPRAKIIAAGLTVLALVVHHSLGLKLVQTALLGGLWFAGRLGGKPFGWGMLALTPLWATTLVSQFLTGLTTSPWVRGAALDVQIWGVVLALVLLVRTTAPTALAEGLERLLAPLSRWKVPVHEAVLMFSIALRFVPLLLEEFRAVSRAQTSRGGGVVHRGVVSRVAGLPALVVPLFVLAILRAQALAEAMESRGYQGAEGRTPLGPQGWSPGDRWVVGVAAANLGVSLVVGFVPGLEAG